MDTSREHFFIIRYRSCLARLPVQTWQSSATCIGRKKLVLGYATFTPMARECILADDVLGQGRWKDETISTKAKVSAPDQPQRKLQCGIAETRLHLALVVPGEERAETSEVEPTGPAATESSRQADADAHILSQGCATERIAPP